MRITTAFLITASLVVSAFPAAAFSPDPISPTQALHNIGQCMTVEGRASIGPATGRQGMQMTLDDGSGKLTGYIAAPASFPNLASLDGQTVDLTGVIQMDYGVPEIEMNSPDYVWTPGNAPDTQVNCENSG